jgi:ATP-dependent Zn protease
MTDATTALEHPAAGDPPETGDETGDNKERPKRKNLAFWDRIKFLLLLAGLWGFLLWAKIDDVPIMSVRDAARDTLEAKWWILALAGLELLRQVHYLISEHWSGWHRFWTESVFGRFEKRTGRLNDWNRYRLARATKWLVFVALLSVVLGAFLDENPARALVRLPGVIWDALPLVLQLLFAVVFIVIQFAALFWFLSRGGVDVYFPDDIKTRFSDVWGQDAVLERVKENIVFLETPEAIEERGGYVPGGLLLWGPPGTGKTLMAEAVAGETGKPFVFVDPGAFINMFFGVGILKVKTLFRKLRKLALRYGGVIVFFDEADSLGSRGGAVGGAPGPAGAAGATPWSNVPECNGLSYLAPDASSLVLRSALAASTPEPIRHGLVNRFFMGAGMGGGGGGMGTLQALLTELSGLKKPRGFVNRIVRRTLGMRPKPPPRYRILVMMATNMPQALDEALLRPGRIDRIYRVGYPSKEGRKRTYQGYLDKVRHELTEAELDRLATITPYATGATIKDLVNEALIVAIRDGREVIAWKDVVKAKLLKTLGPPEDVEYIERERHATAVHEACHAVVAYRTRRHLTIDIATIEKGQDYLGMVSNIPLEEQFTHWRSERETDVMVSLASLAGEKMFYEGDSSAGVSEDLRSATAVVTYMEGYWGMGTTVGSHAFIRGATQFTFTDASTDMFETGLGRRVEARLQLILERTRKLLAENRGQVLAVAHALETHKTVTGDDVTAIIEGREGPLVDGRPYADPAFIAELDAWHQLAIGAHKAHGTVDVALPTSNGHGELEAVAEPVDALSTELLDDPPHQAE